MGLGPEQAKAYLWVALGWRLFPIGSPLGEEYTMWDSKVPSLFDFN